MYHASRILAVISVVGVQHSFDGTKVLLPIAPAKDIFLGFSDLKTGFKKL